MEEIWKDIPNYEGYYQVSNLGRVKSLKRKTKTVYNAMRVVSEKTLKPHNVRGYLYIDLYKNNIRKSFQIHRLVAEAFIPNPNNYPCVNHKDENKQNNCVYNLEFCTYKYNNNYGTARDRAKLKTSKKVNQYDKNYNLIKTWESMIEASRKTKIDRRSIFHCCNYRKNTKTAGGYIWRYANDNNMKELR